MLYARRGFAAEKLVIIPNGFDLDRFRPDPAARDQVRRQLGLAPDTPLVGLVARYDPMKDHATFLHAAALLARERAEVHFVLCGERVDGGNAALVAQVVSLGLTQRCHLLGPRRDVPRIDAALDVAASSSISEAFPLAVGEAMCCGVPCAVTDVGDCGLIVGPTGRVVPPKDTAALANAWCELLALAPAERSALGLSARRRIQERYSIDAVSERYADLYESVLPQRQRT